MKDMTEKLDAVFRKMEVAANEESGYSEERSMAVREVQEANSVYADLPEAQKRDSEGNSVRQENLRGTDSERVAPQRAIVKDVLKYIQRG